MTYQQCFNGILCNESWKILDTTGLSNNQKLDQKNLEPTKKGQLIEKYVTNKGSSV